MGIFMFKQLEVFETKVCIKCDARKPIEQFATRDRGAYHRTECKQCAQAAAKLLKKLRNENDPPPEGYTCPICLGSADEVKGVGGKNNSTWCLDHNHDTKEFRGYLCHKCNRGLGAFDDDIEKLERAMEYLNG